MTKRKAAAAKKLPTDTELLDWLQTSSCKLTLYDAFRDASDDRAYGETPQWHIYNYATGKGHNAATVRHALTLAMLSEAKTMTARRSMTIEQARGMVLKDGKRLADMSADELQRLAAWAHKRDAQGIVGACRMLLGVSGDEGTP